MKERDFNIDFKNPNATEVKMEDPEVLLTKLQKTEFEANELQNKLRDILAQALAQ